MNMNSIEPKGFFGLLCNAITANKLTNMQLGETRVHYITCDQYYTPVDVTSGASAKTILKSVAATKTDYA